MCLSLDSHTVTHQIPIARDSGPLTELGFPSRLPWDQGLCFQLEKQEELLLLLVVLLAPSPTPKGSERGRVDREGSLCRFARSPVVPPSGAQTWSSCLRWLHFSTALPHPSCLCPIPVPCAKASQLPLSPHSRSRSPLGPFSEFR